MRNSGDNLYALVKERIELVKALAVGTVSPQGVSAPGGPTSPPSQRTQGAALMKELLGAGGKKKKKKIVNTAIAKSETEAKKRFNTEEAKAIGEKLGINWAKSKFDIEQFRMGLDVELEHGTRTPKTNVTDDDPVMTGKITLIHLMEVSDYYTKLKQVVENNMADIKKSDGDEVLGTTKKGSPVRMRHYPASDSDWLEHHGKAVKVDGVKHKIHATSHQAIYPHKHTAYSIHAEMTDKSHPDYVETKKKLGDDWSTDLKHSPEFQHQVAIKLAHRSADEEAGASVKKSEEDILDLIQDRLDLFKASNSKSKLYVGFKEGKGEKFTHHQEPTEASHGHKYKAVMGPFKTHRAADLVIQSGHSNPHIQHVKDAERIADRLHREGGAIDISKAKDSEPVSASPKPKKENNIYINSDTCPSCKKPEPDSKATGCKNCHHSYVD